LAGVAALAVIVFEGFVVAFVVVVVLVVVAGETAAVTK
jgi:hypothetical protein